jgi:hypothetical protein
MVQAGVDPKSVQGQMRHSRISTTMDIYAQFVPEGQKLALRQFRAFVERSVPNAQKCSNKPGKTPREAITKSRQDVEKIGGASRDRTDASFATMASAELSPLSV